MPEENYVAAIEAAEIEEKSFRCLQVAGIDVVICRFRDTIYALEDRCSHALASFDKGRMRGYRLLCPVHGAMFDVRDGSALSLPAKKPVRSFPIRVVDGTVEIDVSSMGGSQAKAADPPRPPSKPAG
jgi:nitrite reductase/ring-hydroxylating ferredoxin subunit